MSGDEGVSQRNFCSFCPFPVERRLVTYHISGLLLSLFRHGLVLYQNYPRRTPILLVRPRRSKLQRLPAEQLARSQSLPQTPFTARLEGRIFVNCALLCQT
jgi:hypothetical protein